MSLFSKAKELAEELVRLNETDYQQIFTKADSGEVVVISVVRMPNLNNDSAIVKSATKRFVASASGTVCPRCGGAGKI